MYTLYIVAGIELPLVPSLASKMAGLVSTLEVGMCHNAAIMSLMLSIIVTTLLHSLTPSYNLIVRTISDSQAPLAQ